MLILGVDPGTARTGYGFVRQSGGELEAEEYGIIETSKDTPPPERLEFIHKDILRIIKRYKPDTMAVEKLFFSSNAKTAMSVGEARGVILLAGMMKNLGIYEFTPMQVKMALTGYGKADKSQVGEMVKTLLCLKKIPKPDDVADALAIAVCCASSARMEKIKNSG